MPIRKAVFEYGITETPGGEVTAETRVVCVDKEGSYQHVDIEFKYEDEDPIKISLPADEDLFCELSVILEDIVKFYNMRTLMPKE